MNELVQLTFDYSLVSEEQAHKLQSIYSRVLARHMATNYEDGKDLIEAESIQGLSYEQFIAWARGVFGWSESTIVNKKNTCLYWGDFTPTVGVEDRAVYLLSTSKVPESARQEAKERAEDGEKITEDVARKIRDAHKAKEQAEESERQAQARIKQLNQQIEELQQQEISPKAQEKINKLTEQRDNLSKKVEELGEEARQAALKRNEEEQERKIRQEWRKLTKDFQIAVVKMLSQLPSPIDVQVFEADDWERLSQAKELARRFINECENLSRSPTMIIEAGWDIAYANGQEAISR